MNHNLEKSFSLLSDIYSTWIKFEIPASFYHYFLTILNKKTKNEQINLIKKEILSLKMGTHSYLKIKSSIQARQNSLTIIQFQLPKLKNLQNLKISLQKGLSDRQFLGYRKLFNKDEIFVSKDLSNELKQIANHLRIYRKATLQIIFQIHKWIEQLIFLGYEGFIQFIYDKQDYLESIIEKTLKNLDENESIFQYNPFFLLKKNRKIHKNIEYLQIFTISSSEAKNCHEGLKLLAEHHNQVLRSKFLEKNNSLYDRKLGKSLSLEKLSSKSQFMSSQSFLKNEKFISKQNSTKQTLRSLRSNSEIKVNGRFFDKKQQVQRENNSAIYLLEKKYSSYFSDQKQSQLIKSLNNKVQANQMIQRKFSLKDSDIKQKKSIITEQIDYFQEKMPQIPYQNTKNPQMKDFFNASQKQAQQRQFILQFNAQKNIQPSKIFNYLREIFRKKKVNEESLYSYLSEQRMNSLGKKLLKNREQITIYKVFEKSLLILENDHKTNKTLQKDLLAWMVCKLSKDNLNLQKTVEILFVYLFQQIPTFQQQLIEFFQKHNYTTIKQNGKVVNRKTKEGLSQYATALIRCKFQISRFASIQEVKQIVRSNISLKMSRILKYHTYSKTSKYHKFCEHNEHQNSCQINFYFEEVLKVFIDNKTFLKAKVDSVHRVGQCYKVSHSFNKNTFLILASSIQDLKSFDKQCEKQKLTQRRNSNKDFSQKSLDIGFKFVCFEESKTKRKFINDQQQSVINQFIWIESQIFEVLTVSMERRKFTGSDCLILSKPYILGIYGQDEEKKLKSLAILDFSS